MTSTTITQIRKTVAGLVGLVVITALAVPSLAAASPAPQLGSYHATGDPAAAPVVVTSTDAGFSWGDAAIGASIALAGLAIAVGLALSIKAARHDRKRFRLT